MCFRNDRNIDVCQKNDEAEVQGVHTFPGNPYYHKSSLSEKKEQMAI